MTFLERLQDADWSSIGARVGRFFSALVIALLSLRMLWWIGTPLWLWGAFAFIAVYVLYCVARYQGTWIGWFKRKWREWSTDLKQLGLWTKLAFKPKRDQHDVATMAHQAQFLDGRALSPVNIFTYLPMILGILGVLTIGIDQWRIDRVKKERDAPCSARELSQRGDGEFRTSRASCAQLGATNQVAREWMERAQILENERDTAIETAQRETAATIARMQAEAQRRQALAARQRRRENEGIEAALGGGAPDLERSLCELSGRLDCGPAEPDSSGAVPAATPVVPDASSGAGVEPDATTP